MNKKKELALFIHARIDSSHKTLTEISAEAGFENPNFLSMVRKGKSKLPIRRVPALADALEVPQQELLQRCLEAYYPEVHSILRSLLPAYELTPDEIRFLRGYRELKEQGIYDSEGRLVRAKDRKARRSRPLP